jgi:hypothetical protein
MKQERVISAPSLLSQRSPPISARSQTLMVSVGGFGGDMCVIKEERGLEISSRMISLEGWGTNPLDKLYA